MKNKKVYIFWIALVFIAAVAIGLSQGSVRIPLSALFSAQCRPILFLRLARVLTSILVGAGLGACGVVLQAVLRNPLADPYLLGTSSGAGLGAVLAIILGLSASYLPLAAFIGAALSIILVYNIAREGNSVPVQSLILGGVIVAITLSGIVVFLVSLFGNETLHGMLWWLLGNLQVYDFKVLALVAAIVVLGIGVLFVFSQDLNAISLGEEQALHLGIEVERVKKVLLAITALVTGALVSVSGMIGFVGLIIPHMARMIVGPNHKALIPASCLGAAAFLILCDTLSRSLLPPVEIPIGVITALVGAPVFIVLLRKKQRVG